LRAGLLPLLYEDIVDQAVDDVGGDRGVGAAPEHDARGGDNGEVVQHCRRGVVGWERRKRRRREECGVAWWMG